MPAMPGSPNAATIAASCPCQCSAITLAVAYAPISASNRVSMYATPNRAVSIVISVPGEAARRASSPMSCETLSEMFGLTTSSFIADAASRASGGRSAGTSRGPSRP